MSFSIKLGNFLYKNAFGLYKPMYVMFKNKQDSFEIELLKKHIHKSDFVLDIGSNIGFFSKILSQMVGPNGKVHCFEPDKTNFNHLQDYCKHLGNVHLVNKAVGAKNENLKIYTSKKLNVDHRTYKPEEFDKEIEIEAVSIDEYLGENKKIHFIKMDIQGFEMQAIKGMEKTLTENHEVKIISELWPYGLSKAGSSATEYFNFLTQKGFICYLLEEKSLKRLNPEKVESIKTLSEEHYFNIFATRTNV